MKSRTLVALAIAAAISTASCATTEAPSEAAADTTPPNIIFMIGDGMGFEYISAYRYAMSELGADKLASTPFDDLLVGAATTYPDDDTWVTDSASSATALATGIKSYNGAIGMDANKHPQQTLMELARQNGWLTGAVSTSQVTHATPASFFTHHPSRNMYHQIADSMATPIADGQWSFDVMLGGGYAHFNRDDKNWLPELEAQGMTIVTEFEELPEVQQLPAMGLFAPIGLPHAIDDEPRLASMTEHALRLLTEQQTEGQPFALMIEGSQIDWCGHANDIACAVHEMADFAAAIEVVKAYQAEHPNTLLVITADHSTGGLTLGQGGEYAWYSERVMGIQNSLAFLTERLLEMPRAQWREYLQPRLNLDFSDEDWQQLIEAELPDSERARDQQYALGAVLVPLISKHTRTGWTTTGHTAVDVPVLAVGPYAEQLRGYQDHTDIAKVLLNIVK
ncbi:alkaline phosphatase [Pseudidiomarina aestuarii]|uniref:Alkaline phosphatase n=1 Tax=Pseudidiomarina aestuarii TaxID=624146 RepID=A0A7Z7ET95_9GAMM|nr:alkaline phosphatase [Pseudidiomarina aestuarii]RUO40822.1 alkaline phosphatase [Pseudidiomarina aestuarii]